MSRSASAENRRLRRDLQSPSPNPVTQPPRTALFTTSDGTHREAFTPSHWALAIFNALVFGSAFLWMALGLRSLTPGMIAVGRVAFGTAALVVFTRARAPIARSDWGRIVFLGVVGQAAPAWLFAASEEHITSAVAGMLVSGIPIATATFATLLTRRLPGVRQRIGLATGFLGIVLLALPSLGGEVGSALGIGYVLIAVAAYGLANNLLVPLQQRYGAMAVTLRTLAVATVALLPVGLSGLNRSSFQWIPVLAVVFLGVMGTGTVRATQLALAGRVGAARGSIVAYMVPIVALALGFLVLDERVEAVQLAGVAVTILGAYLVSRAER